MFLLAFMEARIDRNADDFKLMTQIMKREESALSELYERYSPLIYTIALRVVNATDEAEDLVQEVFMQVWNKAGMFVESKGSVYTWIVTIARRKAIDKLRSSQAMSKASRLDDEESLLEVPDPAHTSNPLHAAISTEYEEFMRSGLSMLVENQRTIIEMSYYEGYTQEQISQRLNVPLGTVKTRMRQGLMMLRDHFKERMDHLG